MEIKKNISPWIYQLNRTRPVKEIKSGWRTNVAIVGGGIAGVATTYFTLTNTDFSVTLIEAEKIAHGATGHNGGFLAGYFERTFSDMIAEFGIEKTIKGQEAIDSAWDLLEEIRQTMKMEVPIWYFTGYAGCATFKEVLSHLENDALRKEHGLNPAPILVSKEFKDKIPTEYHPLCKFLMKDEILATLQTKDESYIAALASRKGCMNSAMFCEELINKMMDKYPDRFILAEHTLIKNLVLEKNSAVLHSSKGEIIGAKKVVLCTNGFEKITITNLAGEDINTKFHHLVRGIVGYMAAYTEESDKEPVEISYLPKKPEKSLDLYVEEPYYYLTRRPFHDKDKVLSLISIGGPESLMDDTNQYHREHPYSEEAKRNIDNFLKYTYKHTPEEQIEYGFFWHGLMGFTPNGIRCIGPEPLNPVLYYNLGCNGVGLLPSIYGGKKISRQLLGEDLEPSIFDPKNQTEALTKASQ